MTVDSHSPNHIRMSRTEHWYAGVSVASKFHTCKGCQRETVHTQFLECRHSILCLECTSRVIRCPQCNTRIERISYSQDGEGIQLPHRTLVRHRKAAESKDLEETFQVVLIGEAQSDKMSLLQSILDVCELPEENHGSSSFPISRWFRPNVQVDGVPLRFSVLEGGSWRDGDEILHHVRALRPDAVGICASVLLREKPFEFLKWTQLVNKIRGCAIFWLLLPDKSHGIGLSSDRTAFEKWLRSSGISEKMLKQFYFSLVGGYNASAPGYIAKQVLNTIRSCYRGWFNTERRSEKF